ncbi:GNAT family N-acetyltransferase [Nocardia sp. NPDC048505]|uniref:GNAT family N-acetyltransferase n=1 Tax=unclassified Nocardia TaxID=2637762 RepID=UPI00340E0B04
MMIREGTRADAESVAALHAESWRSAYAGIMPEEFLNGPLDEERLGTWRRRLGGDASSDRLFVAEEAGALLGFVYLVPGSDGRVLLDNLHVRPGAKRSGIGARLLRRGLDWAAAAYPDRPVYLQVLRANVPAINFYERQGGIRTAEGLARFEQGFDLPELEYTWPPAVGSS